MISGPQLHAAPLFCGASKATGKSRGRRPRVFGAPQRGRMKRLIELIRDMRQAKMSRHQAYMELVRRAQKEAK